MVKTEDDPGGHKSKHSGNGLSQLVKKRALSDLKGLSAKPRKRKLKRAGSAGNSEEDGDSILELDQKSSGHYANGRYTSLPKFEDETTRTHYLQEAWQQTASSFYYDQGTLDPTGKAYYQNAHNANNTADIFSSIANKTAQVKEFLSNYNELEDPEDLQDRLEMILQEASKNQAPSHKEAVTPTKWLSLLKYF